MRKNCSDFFFFGTVWPSIKPLNDKSSNYELGRKMMHFMILHYVKTSYIKVPYVSITESSA